MVKTMTVQTRKKMSRTKHPKKSTAVLSKKAIPVEILKKTIAYFYLIAYCVPERIGDFNRATAPMRKELAAQAGMQEAAYFKHAIPQVCRRIVSYQQGNREPDAKLVESLADAAGNANNTPKATAAFQAKIAEISSLPGRATPENRLHRNKGCSLCRAACKYGYFTLISDPQFLALQELMATETHKPANEQSALLPLYGFTANHLAGLAGVLESFVGIEHLAGLSYCLLLLATAKSRQAVPEAQLKILQAANQEFIRRYSR